MIKLWYIAIAQSLMFILLCTRVFAQLPDTLINYDFQQGMPAEIVLLDQDQLTPEAQVDFVDNAWVVRSGEELGEILGLSPTNRVAVSTSFYIENQSSESPEATDDWMILPPVSIPDSGLYTLSWKAGTALSTFPDGYEVRVSTTGNDIVDFDEMIFLDEEADGFLARKSVLLDAYAGEQIHIAFRNQSVDRFLLFIDDISIINAQSNGITDLEIVDVLPVDEYTLVPVGQNIPFKLGLRAFNIGPQLVESLQTNIIIAQDRDTLWNETQFTESSFSPGDTFSIAIDTTSLFEVKGSYQISYNLNIPSNRDIDPSNNSILYNGFALTDTTWARDRVWIDETFTNATGFDGSPEEHVVLAQLFENRKPDILTSASALLYLPDTFNIGDTVFFAAYTLDEEIPVEVGRTEPYVILSEDVSESEGLFLTLKFKEKISLGREKFMIGVHQRGENALFVAYTDELYTPFTSWIRSDSLPDGGWAPIERFEDLAGNSLRFVWVIQAHTGGCSSIVTDILVAPSDMISPGMAIAIPKGGFPPYTYTWIDPEGEILPEADSIISGLSTGSYALMVSDSEGCEQQFNFNIPNVTSTENVLPPESTFSVFPNPSQDYIVFEIEFQYSQSFRINLYDFSGRRITEKKYAPHQRYRGMIDARTYAPGIYYLEVNTSGGSSAINVIMKK